jgi:hypothetical protein
VVDVRPEGNAARSWFHVEKPQREMDGGQSAVFAVSITVPKNVRTGQYWFEGIVYSAHTAPEEFSRIATARKPRQAVVARDRVR